MITELEIIRDETVLDILPVNQTDVLMVYGSQTPTVVEIVTRGPQGSPGSGFGGDFVPGEVPSGAIDSSNMVYTTAAAFSILWVYLGGLRMKEGDDYNITDTNEFTFTYPPTTGANLIVDYVTA